MPEYRYFTEDAAGRKTEASGRRLESLFSILQRYMSLNRRDAEAVLQSGRSLTVFLSTGPLKITAEAKEVTTCNGTE